MQSLQGQLLVASPHLGDPNFYRSVVLVIHHDSDGAFGVVLNRPTSQPVQQVWEALVEEPCRCLEPVYQGGPVPGPLLAVHTDSRHSQSAILADVYLSTDHDQVREVIESESIKRRLFTGYAGWGAGQLERELQLGGWLLAPATRECVFSPPETLWKRLTHQIGSGILPPSLRRRPIPDDPSVN